MYEWRPAPGTRLHGIVERIWHFDGSTADARERVFPDITLELIVQLEQRYRPVVDGRVGTPFAEVCIDGLRTAAATIEAPARRCRIMGVRFEPPGAYAVFSEPLSQITGGSFDLRAVIGRHAGELVERCRAAANALNCIAVAAAWIAKRLDVRTPDPFAAWSARTIVASAGRVRIDALAASAGVTSDRFARHFRTHVGVTPKRFARLARFRRSLDALNEGASLADVVYDGGYYDHPHLDAEFREFGGLSPRDFLQATRFPQSVSLSEAVH